MASEHLHQISNGPGKFDLMVSLFDGNGSTQRTVKFIMEDGRYLTVLISMIEREDGSGESWIFKGYPRYPATHRNVMVEGYYSTKKRTGTMKFVP